MTTKLDQTSPWVTFVQKLTKFFDEDDDISIEYDAKNDPYNLGIAVKDFEKFYILTQMLGSEKAFGNVRLAIDIHPDGLDTSDKTAMYRKFFKSLPIVDNVDIIKPDGTNQPFTYISFRNEVVKYWADSLKNPHGNVFTLWETLAEELFPEHNGVLYTTAEE